MDHAELSPSRYTVEPSDPPSPTRRASHARRLRVAPEKRKRVARACNSCSVRRIKCTGEQPCRQCSKAGRQCLYPSDADKVTVSRAEIDELRARCAQLESRSSSVPTPISHPSSAIPNQEDVATPEGRLLHDPDGTARFLGQSSGATFLNCVKEFMATVLPLVASPAANGESGQEIPGRTFLASVGQYQTYDSRPLYLPPVDPFWLPSRTEMTVMLAEFAYFLQDGNGDFPSGGIFYWGDLSDALSIPLGPNGRREDRDVALLHSIFAVTVQLGTPVHGHGESQRSEVYFSRARAILGNPLDITNHTPRDVSVLLLMSLYLVEMNRRDAAYLTVTMAMHLAMMYGLHFGFGLEEDAKRVFWTLYILDHRLSSWLGRPPSIADAAIRLDMPRDVEGLPQAAGLRAHIELSRISGFIVCNVYRIAPWDQSHKTTMQHVEQALTRLRDFYASLPASLQLGQDSLGQDRACCSLHLAYHQAVILTTRPIFFVAVKKAVADRFVSSQTKPTPDPSHASIVRQCSEAARRNLRLGRWTRDLSPRQKLLHQEAHAVFNAAIILLLAQLAWADADAGDTAAIGFATEVFQREAELGNNFGIDCAKIIHDLNYLVRRLGWQMARQGAEPAPGDLALPEPRPIEIPGDMQEMVGEHAPLYQELEAWLDHDFLDFYNDYLI